MLLALILKMSFMKKRTIITAAAVAAASVATYFVRRKIISRQRENLEPASEPMGRHETNVFAKAKPASSGKRGRPKSARSH
jgi:hypothetical protein